MVQHIKWGTYLFFAAWNAIFIPIMYFFYPETAGRSLEEIDIIFAKGYCENISYVKAARDLPKLTDEQVEQKALEYGFGEIGPGSNDEEKGSHSVNSEHEMREESQGETARP